MEPNPLEKHVRSYSLRVRTRLASRTLQIVLWTVWTSVVAVTGYLSWHDDVVAHRSLNVLGLVIHAGTVGVIGLVVLTIVEMRLEPWRFRE
jgi:hypothetical protein